MTIPNRRAVPTSVLAATVAALSLALAACGGGGSPEPSGTTSAPPTASPSPSGTTPSAQPSAEPSDVVTSPPPFAADTAPDTAEPSAGAQLLLTDIRLAGHDGFDRVVYEYEGEGTPGWNARYVDEAVADASGLPVEVAGSSLIEVTIMGVRYPEEGDDAYDGPSVIRAEGTEVVTEVVDSSIFEGYHQSFVGLDSAERLPFRVYLLEDPVRVVVDVAHPTS